MNHFSRFSKILFPLWLVSCGSSEHNAELKTITAGRITGTYSSWITTNTDTKFESSKSWALESGYSYFPEVSWNPEEDILWTFDTTKTSLSRDELKKDGLRNDSGPFAKLLADWFRYLSVDSFPSPIWKVESDEAVSEGLILIKNFDFLEESSGLADKIYFKTYFRMKGDRSEGQLNTRIVAVCSKEVDEVSSSDYALDGVVVVKKGETVKMPSTVFMETVSEDPTKSLLISSDWTYLKSEVLVGKSNYQSLSSRCNAAQGELNAYLGISASKIGTSPVLAQFITTEMIKEGEDQ